MNKQEMDRSAASYIAGRANPLISMKLSARNAVEGEVISVDKGAVAAIVKVQVDHPFVVTSMITKEAAEDLKLKKGEKVRVIVKSTEVIIAKE